MSVLGRRDSWGPAFVTQASEPDPYRLSNTGGPGSALNMARLAAWQTTGDKTYLEAMYGAEIQSGTQRMSMMTDGELWTDRVQMPSEMLQRSRLGGVGARRGQTFPGNVVSWRFGGSDSADSVAILIPEATPSKFKVIVFNVEDHPVQATLIGGGVAPGDWRVSEGVDADGDDRADAPRTRTVTFEQGVGLPLTLAPKQTTVLEFDLTQAGTPMARRPDVGIDPADVKLSGRSAEVTVHSLGGIDAPAGEVILEDASGVELGRAAFGALPAPADLLPKTETVRLRLARAPSGPVFARLVLTGAPREITDSNNRVQAP
jgi:hypothetical protein